MWYVTMLPRGLHFSALLVIAKSATVLGSILASSEQRRMQQSWKLDKKYAKLGENHFLTKK
jgi:hypothetical protein